MILYTKNSRPLQRSGDDLYSCSGRYLGRVRHGKVYDPSGKYASTIVGDRGPIGVTDGATIGSPSVSANGVETAPAAFMRRFAAEHPDKPDVAEYGRVRRG